jgi:DNA repair exonuclease SbcCD ATPase subunit
LESVRASLEQEQKKSCSAAEARDKALQTSRSQSLLHKDALEAAKRDAKSRSAEAIALLRDELTPLQEELKRLSPLESELSDARRIGELLQSQIGQSHEREDQLRSELSTAKEELESMRKQLAEAQGLRAKEAQSKSDSRSAAQKQKDMELAAFKKELADVRAKQLFAVNEVKVLMAKLAAKGGNGKSHGGSSNSINNSINNSAECGEAQQIDFIDENLKRLKQRKGRKGASGSGFVTSGNYTKKQGGAQRMHRKR